MGSNEKLLQVLIEMYEQNNKKTAKDYVVSINNDFSKMICKFKIKKIFNF